MFDLFTHLFDPSGFPARWHCGTWSAGLGWLHIVSDVGIWGAYTAIPIVLTYFVLQRKDAPFPALFWLFCAFIYSCGLGHLIEAIIFWWPVYRLAGVVKAITAVVSWLTVAALIPAVPRALNFPRLAKVNSQLQTEVARRTQAQADLNAKATELAQSNAQLERFNRLAVGREERMIELKREINRLSAELGRLPPFNLDFHTGVVEEA